MSKDEDLQKALNLSYFYLKFRPRTKKELRDYLTRKAKRYHWSAQIVEEALSSLDEQGLIDDLAFVLWFVEQRSKRKPKSTFLLRRELLGFGVPKETINLYFDTHAHDDLIQAKKALSARWERLGRYSQKDRFKKAVAFLTRRGFSFAVIKKTIAEFEKNQ